MNKPILGVLGGVGPMATAYFMQIVIKKTNSSTDQGNIPMIVYNDPQIPDRTAYILDHEKPNPRPEMTKVARWLENAGADYIAIPCNTAHYFYDDIVSAVDIPVLNIMELTSRQVAKQIGKGGCVGLLATDGTIETNVFQNYFESAGLTTTVPGAADRKLVMSLIYEGVKAGRPYDPNVFLEVADRLRHEGCDAVVIGCTELSVIYQDLPHKPSYLLDSLDVLSDECVSFYKNWRSTSQQSQ